MNNQYTRPDRTKYSAGGISPRSIGLTEGTTNRTLSLENTVVSNRHQQLRFSNGVLEYDTEQQMPVANGIPISIQGYTKQGYRFIQPIPANLRYMMAENTWLITDDLFNEYGVGQTIQQARRDYLSGLVSYYEALAEWATDENVATQIQYEELRRYFIKDE